VITINGTYAWSFVTQILHNGQQSHGGDQSFLNDDFKEATASKNLFRRLCTKIRLKL